MVLDMRDQPLLMTRSEKGISMAGNSGLRIPPVSACARNISRKRGTILRVSACDESVAPRKARLRLSQTKNMASDAMKLAESATTRKGG